MLFKDYYERFNSFNSFMNQTDGMLYYIEPCGQIRFIFITDETEVENYFECVIDYIDNNKVYIKDR